jgi:hypothetical protein
MMAPPRARGSSHRSDFGSYSESQNGFSREASGVHEFIIAGTLAFDLATPVSIGLWSAFDGLFRPLAWFVLDIDRQIMVDLRVPVMVGSMAPGPAAGVTKQLGGRRCPTAGILIGRARTLLSRIVRSPTQKTMPKKLDLQAKAKPHRLMLSFAGNAELA